MAVTGNVSANGQVTRATPKELLDFYTILNNKAGDEMWRWFDDDNGKPQWKVWAVNPHNRSKIARWKEARWGAHYDGRDGSGFDFVIPKKNLFHAARLLGLDLRKNVPRRLTPSERKVRCRRLAKARQAIAAKREKRGLAQT